MTMPWLPNEVIQVVLDDGAVDRLRTTAALRGMELEQLVVDILHAASHNADAVLPAPPMN